MVDQAIAQTAQGALKDLRAARRHRHVEELDWIDALYRVYLVALFGALGLALLSGALGDGPADDNAVREITKQAPALLGLLVALGIAGGLRSGGRGGPLAIEAADVQHVLLSPVDRGVALRWIAVRQLRSAAFFGSILGMIAGNFAFRQLPGSPPAWIAVGAVFGAIVPVWALGSAMVASGRRWRPSTATVLAVLVGAWSLADVLLATKTSPATMLAELALWPINGAGDSFIAPTVAVALALATTYVGLSWIGRTSLDAARRRAGLAAELRFAVTVQDLRTAILLRRQLASENPRRRPWVRLSPSPRSRLPVWRRAWHSFLRWPAVRIGRVCAFGVIAGLATCAAWQGTTPLLLVAAASLMVAGFDAIEPMAQEVDHPTQRDLLPIPPERLIRLHLVAPTALMLGVSLAALAAALVVQPSALVLEVGAVVALPAALLVLCSVALSSTNDPYAFLLVPWLGYIQTAVPFVLAVGATLPVLAAREADRHGASPVGAAATSELAVLVLCTGVIWFLGRRVARRVAVKP
jgi:hypothetical protein